MFDVSTTGDTAYIDTIFIMKRPVFKEKSRTMLYLECSFLWCWNLDTSEGRSVTHGKFDTWSWRMTEIISWTDCVRYEEVLHRVKDEWNTLHTISRRKANRIGHVLRRICLLKHVIKGKIEGRIEVTGRRGRRCKELQSDRKGKRGSCKLNEEALVRSVRTTCLGRGYAHVVRRTMEWVNIWTA